MKIVGANALISRLNQGLFRGTCPTFRNAIYVNRIGVTSFLAANGILNRWGRDEIEAFLTYLAVNRRVSAPTQNQAFSALLLLYCDAFNKDLDFPIDSVRACICFPVVKPTTCINMHRHLSLNL